MRRGPSAIFLHRFYWPDVAAAGQMLTDLAEDLAAQGWSVTVVTSRTGYEAQVQLEVPREEVRNGVRIIRVRTTRFGRNRLIGRLGDTLTYFAGVLWQLMRLPRPDLVTAMSEPPFLLVPALLIGRLRRIPTVYWLQDLHPHLAGQLGLIEQRTLLYRALESFARALHSRCDAIVTLGAQMTRVVLANGGRSGRVTHVHNWADAQAIRPVAPEDNPFVQEHGLQGKFVVLYSGNAGRAHTFDAVTEAMRRLADRADIVFVFIGGGKRLAEIQEVARAERLPNTRFLNYLPRAQLSYSLSAASVSLVTENPEVVGLLVPSKTYGIMASGRPVLFVGSEESDVAEVVLGAECGIVVSPDDPEALVTALLRLKDSPSVSARMGARGRRAALEIYDRRRATHLWACRVEEILFGADTVQRSVPPEPGEARVPSPASSELPAGGSWKPR